MSAEDLLKSECTCSSATLADLIGAWTSRSTALISEGLARGEAPDQALLRETVGMIQALSKGARRAYAPENAKYYHHLPDCPFDKLGRKQPLCRPARCGV